MSKVKVAIQYGVFAGEHTGRRLRQALQAAGYEVTRDSAAADIIVAHSAGCFWLPTAPTKQRLVLINPPYWPGKSLHERARLRGRSNFRFRRHGYLLRTWLVRNLWGIYYAVRDSRRTRQIIQAARTYDLDAVVAGHHALLIRNEHDDWLTPNLDELLSHHPALKSITLPGDHDDLTHHPKRYVDLLKSDI